MKMNRRGLSTMGTVAAIVAGLAVLAIAAYFISAPFRTNVNKAYSQFAEWTPENIAANPLGYLDFCEEQTKGALKKCESSKIAIAQKQAKLEQMETDTRDKLRIGGDAFKELKEAYSKAEADDKWPLAWSGKQLDKDAAKRQIVKLDGEIRGKTELAKKYKDAVAQLRTQLNKVEEAKDKAKEQLAKIDTNREMLKVQQITDDLKNNLVAMKGAIQTTIGDLGTETGSLSLDDLAAQSEAKVDDSKFDEIMKKKD